MLRMAVNGCNGRMGTCVRALAERDDACSVVASIDARGVTWHDEARDVDAVIDFSNDLGARSACRFAVDHRAALLIATTALSDATHAAIDEASRSIPVIVAANTSYGIAVVDNLITAAANLLDAQFDISIIETHHARKRDRPSGTALRLADSIASAGGRVVPRDSIHAVRTGDVVGDHQVIFGSNEELISISHRALSREVFARGALRAINWLAGQQPGRYEIAQAWGLTDHQ